MKIFYLSLILLFSAKVFSQNVFEKTYDLGNIEQSIFIQQSTDSGFYIAGNSAVDLSQYNWDGYLKKTNKQGDTQWTKTFSNSDYSEGLFVAIPTADSGFLLGLTSDDAITFEENIWLVKTDKNGIILWTQLYGNTSYPFYDGPFGLAQTSDGGYIISSVGQVPGNPYDLLLIKTDANGTVQWDSTYGGVGDEFYFTNKIIQTYDSGYVIFSATTSSGNGGYDFYLIKIGVNGDSLWSKTFGTSGDDIPFQIEQTPDSGFILLGKFDTSSAANMLTLIKTDKDGNFQWEKHPARKHLDIGKDFKITADGGMIITGYTNDSLTNLDVLLIKTDVNGDTVWTKNFGGLFNDQGISICKTNDNSFGIAANTEGFGSITNDIYFIKTDSNGNMVCPKTGFVASDTAFCGSKAISFNNTTIGTSQYTWHNNGNVFSNNVNSTYFFNNAGTYNIQLINCNDTSSLQIISNAVHSADFSFVVKHDSVIFSMTDSNNLLSFQWDFGDSSLDALNKNPMHIYDSVGLYAVTLIITDLNGCTNDTIEQVSILPNGVSEFRIQNSEFRIYPNPFSTSATISIPTVILSEAKNLVITLYDVLGREVLKQPIVNPTSEIVNPSLPSGIYFYKVCSEKKETIANGKLVVE